MKSVFLPLAVILTLAGCGVSKSERVVYSESAPFIVKEGTKYKGRMESTPLIFRGARIDVVSKRPMDGSAMDTAFGIEIYDASGALVSYHPTTLGYTSALVANDTVYVFGTDRWTRSGNALKVISSTDLVTWSDPVVLIQADAATTFYNSSVASDAEGFVLALESCKPNENCFRVTFYKSADLTAWTLAGAPLNSNIYTACPTIRYANGYYYTFFLSSPYGYFNTLIARSADLTAWDISPVPVVSPDQSGDEGNNTSDLDLVETADGVEIRYAVGYQTIQPGSFDNINGARFPGTLTEFLEKFFN